MNVELHIGAQRLEDELRLVEAMANELESYIVEGEVYRTLLVATTNGNERRTMSGGDLLTRVQNLQAHAHDLSASQQSRLASAMTKVQSTIYALHTRYNELLRHELKVRRNQLHWNVSRRRARGDDKADPAELYNRRHIQAIEDALGQMV